MHQLEALHDNVSDFQRDANIITFTPTLIAFDKLLPYLSSCKLCQICVRGSQNDEEYGFKVNLLIQLCEKFKLISFK